MTLEVAEALRMLLEFRKNYQIICSNGEGDSDSNITPPPHLLAMTLVLGNVVSESKTEMKIWFT